MVARFGLGVGLSRFGGEHLAELDAEAVPIGADILVADDLRVARAERYLQVPGRVPRESGECLGVEAELEDVAGLGLGAGQLGVDWLPADLAGLRIDLPLQEVGHAPHTVVHERHLEEQVDVGLESREDALDPGGEGFVLALVLHPKDRPAVRLVAGQDIRPRARGPCRAAAGRTTRTADRSGAGAGLDLVLQRQVVRAVQPRRDLRRSQESFCHHTPPDRHCAQPIPAPWNRHRTIPSRAPAGRRRPVKGNPSQLLSATMGLRRCVWSPPPLSTQASTPQTDDHIDGILEVRGCRSHRVKNSLERSQRDRLLLVAPSVDP